MNTRVIIYIAAIIQGVHARQNIFRFRWFPTNQLINIHIQDGELKLWPAVFIHTLIYLIYLIFNADFHFVKEGNNW